jgi:hypothetical protein
MYNAHAINANFQYVIRLAVCIAFLSSAFAWAAKTDSTKTVLGNNEETFVFAGMCPNGEPYRLVSYQKNVSGLSSSYYDYDAPVGKGTVQSDATPKVMAVRVCRKLTEIINTHYWE